MRRSIFGHRKGQCVRCGVDLTQRDKDCGFHNCRSCNAELVEEKRVRKVEKEAPEELKEPVI